MIKMDRNQLIQLLKNKNVISETLKRKFCWKNNFDKECEDKFTNFAKGYRTEKEAWFCLLHDIEPKRCEICGDLAKFTGRKNINYNGYNTTCEKCSANSCELKKQKFKKTVQNKSKEEKDKIINKRRQTNLLKYGDEHYMLYGSKSFKSNLLNKYGSETYNNPEKIKNTCLEKYGVTCNLKLINTSEHAKNIWDTQYDSIINKIKETNKNKLGVDFVGQSEIVKDKILKTKQDNISKIEKAYNCTIQSKLIKTYGQGWLKLDLEKIIINHNVFISNEDIYKIEQYNNSPKIINYTSKAEKEIYAYIKSIYNGQILKNIWCIIPNGNNRFYELDIYLPEKNIAFEFNGNYWHSNKFKDNMYHQRKTIACYKNGVQLHNIYEFEWKNNKPFIQNCIKQIISGEICEKQNWIRLDEFEKYTISLPEKLEIGNNIIYNEGKFIKIK